MSEPRAGIDGLAEHIAAMRRFIGGRVPSYDRVLALVADRLGGELGRRLDKAWARRWFGIGYDRPLLLLATLRYDALCTGPDHPLWTALAAESPDPDAVTDSALELAFARDRPRVWHSLTRRWVQTNEVSRAIAWLWPAALAGADLDAPAAGAARPIALCDLGCSAGLNLVADALELGWTEIEPPGPLAVARRPHVVRRLGFDRAPLDPGDDDAGAWLRACIWAGQTERQQRLDRALAAFRVARESAAPPAIQTIDARDIPDRLHELSAGDDRVLWLAYQTLVRDYLGESREPYADGMRRWLVSRPPGRAAWIELETAPHGGSQEHPAALVAHVAGSDGSIRDLLLARCDYHPVAVRVDAGAVADFRAALA